ncbi:H-type lectin domain protein (macronuclear) [Tetrahymena thermophila SB210]|uniref:H-type lectin domain protein n=1 Tax=Tetrahymena thermophila (strain SB210) TaxID=312017 RepID=Q22NZ7_TETTS|nr:H-type lectin domain protein [Tetrahymena thermophila SB210]EAR87014.2 H-type lectin domain protein [Tetrahymena thermophila SB210]|eukprot:XP_001007259.2 H-type lectin domain protein [Tetrahymena thermophila SB210]
MKFKEIQKAIFKCFIFIACHFIEKLHSQYVSSDQVFINDVELVSYSNPLVLSSTQQSDIITVYFNVNFQNTPKIIVGYKYIDYDHNSNQKSFEMVVSNINTNSFQLQFIKYQDTKVYRIIATYVAIDSNYAYQNQVTLNFQPWPSNNQVTVSTQFSNQSIDVSKVQRKAFGFIQGIISNTNLGNIQVQNIQMTVQVSTNTIDVTAIQNDSQQCITQIKVNYLEFYVNITNPYYDLKIIVDSTYLVNKSYNIGVYPSQATLDFNNNADIQGVVIALTSYNVPLTTYSARLNMTLVSYTASNKILNYQYQTWVDTVIYSFGSTIAVFKMIDCSSNTNNPVNHSANQQCVSQCPQGFSLKKRDASQGFSYCQINSCSVAKCQLCNSNGGCILCSPQMYLFNYQCYASQPPQTYCDNQLNCYSCLPQCKSCNNSSSCTSCFNQYQFNGICYDKKPNNTYCDQNQVCTKCQDSSCSNCDSQNVCISCNQQNPYYFQNKCYPAQQDYTYCDSSNICFSCNPLCLYCSGPNSNQCIQSCSNGFVLINNKCQCLQAGFGYDPVNQNCVQCKQNLCADCYGDYTQCQQCQPGSAFNPSNNQCECSDPLYYFDIFFQKCKKSSVANCKVSSKTIDQCIQCNDGYFLNKSSGQCTYCTNKTFTDNQNICRLQCRQNCLVCINATDCIQEEGANNSNQNNNNNNSNNNNGNNGSSGQVKNCHYSCDKCSQSNSPNSCLTCASPSTRVYNPQSFQCLCKVSYIDDGNADCQELVDLDSSIFNSYQVAFYISFALQSIFVLGINSTNYQHILIIQQYIYLLTFFPSFNKNLQFYQLISLFRYLSIFTLFENIQLISKASYSLNLLIIFTSVLAVSVLIAYTFHFARFSFAYASYFKWNLIFLSSRIISLFSFVLIFNVFLKQQQYTDSLTLTVVLIYLFFYFIKTILHIKGIMNENNQLQENCNASGQLDNSTNLKKNINLKSALEVSMEKPQSTPVQNQQNVEIEMIQNFTQQQALIQSRNKKKFISPYQTLFCELDLEIKFSKYFWLIVEIKNIIVGFIIGYFGDNIWAYYILPAISFINIIIHSFNKTQTDSKKRNLVFFIESIVLIILSFFCFYISLENQQSDQSKIIILIISCCIFIISISIIIFHIAIILDYLKDKLDSKNTNKLHIQNQTNHPQCNMRMQNYFTKDQINAILDQPSYFSNSTSSRKKRRNNF